MEEILEYILTFIIIGEGIIIATSSLIIVIAYIFKHSSVLRHVAPLAAAHFIFTILALSWLYFNKYQLHDIRGISIFIAFTLSTYGLGYLLWVKAMPKLFPNRFKDDE